MTELLFYLVCAGITALIQLSGFLVSFALQTEKFYDILGGVNYIALMAWSAINDPSLFSDLRKCAVSLVFVCSRCWLLLFLAWRAHERGGDARFDGVKDKFFRFGLFWMVQGIWVFFISMPVLFVNASGVSDPLSLYDWITVSCFAIGVAVEAVADIQKAIWVKQGRPGGFCQTGLWRFSRHPNYFGEMFQMWCAWAYAFSSSQGFSDPWWWASAISPVFTMHVLLNLPPTGVWNAEGKNLKRYYDKYPEEYSKYHESTSILIPMIGYKYVPLLLKRTVFMDFGRYQYRQKKEAPAQETTKASVASSASNTTVTKRSTPSKRSESPGAPKTK